MDEETLQLLAARAAPSPIPLASSDGTHEQRLWIVRLREELPDDRAATLEAIVQGGTVEATRAGRVERGLDAESEHGDVTMQIHRATALHLIVRVTTVVHRLDLADTSLLAQAAALRALHVAAPIEDIQGFPREYWRVLIGD